MYRFVIDLGMDFGFIFDVVLTLFRSRVQPSKSSKTFVFKMNFNDFTFQRSMVFDDFRDLFRYQFWH